MEKDDNRFIKTAFFKHLERQGFTAEHLEAYEEYFDFFLDRLGGRGIMEVDPGTMYQVAFNSVEDLEGEEVVEAYLKLMEFFIEFWAERYESMQPYRDLEEEDEDEMEEDPD